MTTAELPIKVLGHWSEMAPADRERLRQRGTLQVLDPQMRLPITNIIEDVRDHGDEAVLRALATYDQCVVRHDQLRVQEEEFARASEALDPEVREAIHDGIDHIRRFNEQIRARSDWSFESEPGLTIGEKATPIESVGLFIPGGKASYPSVLMQLGTAAVVAGVRDISVAVPPLRGEGGRLDDAVLMVAQHLGISNVFRVNGPAGVAAFAFGTESIPKVRMVVGPGSPAVVCAQLEVQRYGCVTAVLMGPSESLVLADDSAHPRLLAADLLNEAEHGPDSASILVTDSLPLLKAAQEEVRSQLGELPEPRRSYAVRALGENGGAILVRDMMEGAEVVNDYAPEHLMVVVQDEDEVVARLENAGEILIGQWTPISAANYLIGCPATLPTGGFAKVSSGVTAGTFLKRTAIARANPEALQRMSASIRALASYEVFPAHENAVQIRAEYYPERNLA